MGAPRRGEESVLRSAAAGVGAVGKKAAPTQMRMLHALEAVELLETPLHQYLLREVLAEPLHRLIAFRLHESSGDTIEVTASNRKSLLDSLTAVEGASKVASLTRLLSVFSKGKDSAKDAKSEKAAVATRGGKVSKGDKGPRDAKSSKRSAKAQADDLEEEEEPEAPDAGELLRMAASDANILCRKVDRRRGKALALEKKVERRAQLLETASADSEKACALGLHLALLEQGAGTPGLLFPPEAWAMRLVAQSIGDKAARKEALTLLHTIGGDDAVASEAAVGAWRERWLGGGDAAAAPSATAVPAEE
eukprot:NODE_2029_length_1011_cov_202.278243.p1 GENE.NODE_2029_length_1011_cov_202.278243~~NODE_2029_length_1011_cov_202.278243.p1  ORF type:complete len:307 (+),score=77.72 NODE_2029_length_1011_cov_202.278243:3-923(+)